MTDKSRGSVFHGHQTAGENTVVNSHGLYIHHPKARDNGFFLIKKKKARRCVILRDDRVACLCLNCLVLRSLSALILLERTGDHGSSWTFRSMIIIHHVLSGLG